MKKIVILLIVLLSFIFTGCGNNDKEDIYGELGILEWVNPTLVPETGPDMFNPIVIPAEGGTYTFTTHSDLSPVIHSVCEGSLVSGHYKTDKSYFVKETEGATEHHIITPSLETTINQSTMAITIQPNTTEKDRYIGVYTTIPKKYMGLTLFRQKGEILK